MTYFPLYQTTCFFIPLVAPCTPLLGVDEYTLEQDIILMSNADAGWVVRVCGEIGMDQLVKVARNLEIRETGKVLTCDDFEGNHFAFMDGGVG